MGKFWAIIMLLCCGQIARGEGGIVPAEMADSGELKLAAGFLNHYYSLLNSQQTEAVRDSIQRVADQGFTFNKGSNAAFKTLTSADDFLLNLSDGQYQAIWRRGGQVVVDCQFPAVVGLLMMKNKISLESNMADLLSKEYPPVEKPAKEISRLEPIMLTDFYSDNKGYCITPRLSHNVIYQGSEADKQMAEMLVDSDKYNLETVSNVMLTGYNPFPLTVNLKQSLYGYKSQTLTLPFANLFQALSSEGSVPYWGVEQFDGKKIKGVYVWMNTYGGYAHVLSVEVPMSILSRPSEADAKLHCYVRFDNIKNLFEEL